MSGAFIADSLAADARASLPALLLPFETRGEGIVATLTVVEARNVHAWIVGPEGILVEDEVGVE